MASEKDIDRWETWVREALGGRHLHEPSPAAMRRALAVGDRLATEPGTVAAWLMKLM